MDPITHTMTGAALGGAGLRRLTPLAMPMLVIAANAPDVDILVYLAGGENAGLAFRRGWTHGILALVLWPFLLTGSMLGWDRWVRRARDPGAAPASSAPLLLLAAVGVLTHPTLDWLNNYGMRWLMPFDGTWFYGDALFIIDPWVWLALGGALFLAHSRSVPALAGWLVLGAAATVLILGADMVPVLARALWIAGVLALAVARMVVGRARTGSAGDPRAPAPDRPTRPHAERLPAATERPLPATERYMRWAIALVALYMTASVAADRLARSDVRAVLDGAGYGPIEDIMVAPSPADPLGGSIVAVTPGAYYSGTFHWARRPRVSIRPDSIARAAPPDMVAAVAKIGDVRDYLVWARYPFFHVAELPDGYRVLVGDARYADLRGAGSLRGLVVELDAELRHRPP